MKRITASLLVLILMFSASPATPTVAFNPQTYNASFEDGSITACFESGITADNKDVILAGFNLWQQAIDFTASEWGLCVTNPSLADLYVSSADLGDCGGPYARTGQGISEHNPYSNFHWMVFNIGPSGDCPFSWVLPPDAPTGSDDAFTIAAHEFGHVIGLGEQTYDASYSGITTDNKDVHWTFNNADKKDVTHTWPGGPKIDTGAGYLYSGSLDSGVGNFSSSPRPTLRALTGTGQYHVITTIANSSLSRNPNGVRIDLFRGTTLIWTSPYTTGQAVPNLFSYNIPQSQWTTNAEFRFRVQSSLSRIYDVQIFGDTTPLHVLMDGELECQTSRAEQLAQDDADGARWLYPTIALTSVFASEVTCY